MESDGLPVTRQRCSRCAGEWDRPVETDLDTQTFVRADLDDETVDGFIDEIDGDRIRVRGRWAQRWQVQEY
jgi:hypothetical protein